MDDEETISALLADPQIALLGVDDYRERLLKDDEKYEDDEEDE